MVLDAVVIVTAVVKRLAIGPRTIATVGATDSPEIKVTGSERPLNSTLSLPPDTLIR